MSTQASHDTCCGGKASLGTFEGGDVAALDHLAVKLICLDSRFAPWLEHVGRLLGCRLAVQCHPEPVSFDEALASLISSCGFEGTIEFRVLRSNEHEALLQINGCCVALGWQVPRVDRLVCSFDAGLIEGFLSAATGERALTARETTCLGFGDAACEFIIHRQQAPDTGNQERRQHDQH
jgi:predicted hydrocarbon binding protein